MSARVRTLPLAKSASATARRAESCRFRSNQVKALPLSVAAPLAVTLSVLPTPPMYTSAPLARRTSSVPAPDLTVIGTLRACCPLTLALLSRTVSLPLLQLTVIDLTALAETVPRMPSTEIWLLISRIIIDPEPGSEIVSWPPAPSMAASPVVIMSRFSRNSNRKRSCRDKFWQIKVASLRCWEPAQRAAANQAGIAAGAKRGRKQRRSGGRRANHKVGRPKGLAGSDEKLPARGTLGRKVQVVKRPASGRPDTASGERSYRFVPGVPSGRSDCTDCRRPTAPAAISSRWVFRGS